MSAIRPVSFSSNSLSGPRFRGEGIRVTVNETLSQVPTASYDKMVKVRLKPLLPLIFAISALAFNEGQRKSRADAVHGEIGSSWQNIIAESVIGYMLLRHTAGVYPLLGLGLSIYRASRENNALDQIKAVINTVVPMGMGFIGANLLDPDMMENMENQKIRKMLELEGDEGNNLRKWLSGLKTHADDGVKQMGHDFDTLKKQLIDQIPQAGDQKNSKILLKALREQIGETKGKLAEQIEHVGGLALESAEKHDVQGAAKQLLHHIAEGQSTLIKFTRNINPICCFMFAAFWIGKEMANWINGHLEHKQPKLKEKAWKQELFPDSQRIIKPTPEKPKGPVHQFQDGPYPYAICPDVAGGKPLYFG